MLEVECKDGSDNPKVIQIRKAALSEDGTKEGVSLSFGKLGQKSREWRGDYYIELTPDAAKRLAIALDHVAFKIDPATAALGVEGGESIPSREQPAAKTTVMVEEIPDESSWSKERTVNVERLS